MKILFVGQRGIPHLGKGENTVVESRVEALAVEMVSDGHQVAVTCASPFIAKSLADFKGVELVHLPSFDPRMPGGWLHTWLEIRAIWRRQPDVVHVHGWRMALLSRVAALLCPEATFILTVDQALRGFGPHLTRWLSRRGAAVFDVVTVPRRALQYLMLTQLYIKAHYVPDGYSSDTLTPLPLKHYGLRARQQYGVVTAQSAKEVRATAKAWAEAGLGRRKLVVMAANRGAMKRVAGDFSFLHMAGGQAGRRLDSLLAQASIVLLTGRELDQESVLKAMDSGKAIVVAANCGWEEVLGVAAVVYTDDMAAALRQIKTAAQQRYWGAKARKRAQAHFPWARIVPEYTELYHYPVIKVVQLDSAKQATFTEAAA